MHTALFWNMSQLFLLQLCRRRSTLLTCMQLQDAILSKNSVSKVKFKILKLHQALLLRSVRSASRGPKCVDDDNFICLELHQPPVIGGGSV